MSIKPLKTLIGKKITGKNLLFNWWAHLGSNQGPPDYESGALTD
jgi:hypothetical protein